MQVLRRRPHVKRHMKLASVREREVDRNFFTGREGLLNTCEHEVTTAGRQRHLIVCAHRKWRHCAHLHNRAVHHHLVHFNAFGAWAFGSEQLIVGVGPVDDSEIAGGNIYSARCRCGPSVFYVQTCVFPANIRGWRCIIVLRMRLPARGETRQKRDNNRESSCRRCAATRRRAQRALCRTRAALIQLSGPVLSKNSAWLTAARTVSGE